jgi:tetratricopeptide (TPR) repeat protein
MLMANDGISIDRIISRLDEYLSKNDQEGAKRHLHYWLDEAINAKNGRVELLLRNELMGIYRKNGNRSLALENAEGALAKIKELGIESQVGSATTYLNVATVYKSFGMAKEALPIFEKAKAIYESSLEKNDSRLAGLYNNMALALVDEGLFDKAYELYDKALKITNGTLETAITHLNIASAKEAELGLEDADEQIQKRLESAREILENHESRDGYYAFVCEKCAGVFGYYGHFAYEQELNERARRIYEGN